MIKGFQLAKLVKYFVVKLLGSKLYYHNISNLKQKSHTKHKYLRGKPFFFKGKITGQTLNKFIIIKLITTILKYVMRLKKKFLLFFFALSHTNYLSQRRQHFARTTLSLSLSLSWLSFSSLSGSFLVALSFLFVWLSLSFLSLFSSICSNPPCCCSNFPLAFLLSENFFFLSQFHALFSLFRQGGPLCHNHQILCSIIYL